MTWVNSEVCFHIVKLFSVQVKKTAVVNQFYGLFIDLLRTRRAVDYLTHMKLESTDMSLSQNVDCTIEVNYDFTTFTALAVLCIRVTNIPLARTTTKVCRTKTG